MANKLYNDTSIKAIADAIRSKNGKTDTYTVGEMAGAISSLSGKESVTWHQCPEAPRNFINNVTYDPNDYSTSQIQNYAPATAVVSNTKPIGKTVNGITYYNQVPNTETPFASTNSAGTLKPLDKLRWLNTSTENVRDLGGWSCDGGTVKYGMLFRGGEPNVSDKSLMVDKIGVKHELQLRGTSEEPQPYSIWGIEFSHTTNYVWLSVAESTKPTWKEIFRCVFDTVPYNLPLYFHCAAGADRTATVAVMLEALLGMSQSDIDKDYELTCFSTGTGTDLQARRRNEDEYKNYIAAIKAIPIPEGVEDTFRNHAIYFVASLGFTADEINAYRSAMIDGNPEAITLSLGSFTVTKSGSNITFDNNISSVNEYQEYRVNLSPNSGYVISDVIITMGGSTINAFTGEKINLFRRITNNLAHCTTNNTNYNCIDGQGYGAIITAEKGYTLDGGTISITVGGVEMAQQYYSNGAITIPNVSGDVVINVTAVQQGPAYTNIWDTPYKLNSRLNTAEDDPSAPGMYISAWYSMAGVDTSQNIVFRSNINLWNHENLNSLGDYFRGYNTMTAGDRVSMQTVTMHDQYFISEYDETSGIYSFTVKPNYWTGNKPNYIRWCAMTPQSPLTDSYFDGCVLTINEEIN